VKKGKQYSIEMNYKTLSYLQMILHQFKHDGLRDSDEKRRYYDIAMSSIHKGIEKAYNHFIEKKTKVRVYKWE